MAQDQAVLDRPGTYGVPASLSDRSVVMRWLIHIGRFFRYKPLGGAGAVIIGLCVFAGLFGNAAHEPDVPAGQHRRRVDDRPHVATGRRPDGFEGGGELGVAVIAIRPLCGDRLVPDA